MRVALAPDKTACVEIEVLPGEIPQIVAQNPNDLILTLIGPDERKVDGFQFGNETITLDKPGHYRINLEIHSYPKGEAILPVSMSRHELSLQAAALWKSAEAMATTSKASRKLSDIQASLELWKAIGDSSAIGRTKLKLGDAFHDAGDQISALDAYEQALADCRPAGEVRCAAEAANNSGLAARLLGEFELAHKRLHEAIEDWQYLHSPSNEGRTLSNLGILYTRGGDFQLALSTYSRAKRLLWQTDKLAYGRVLNNLGLCYLSLGEYEKSQIYLEQAIATETRLKEGEVDAMRARVNLGRILMSEGRLTEAKKILESALKELDLRARQGHGDATARSFALDDLGETLWREGQFERAGELLKEALPMHRSARDRRGEARALHYLGLVAAGMGQIEESRKLLGEAIQLRRVWGLRDDNADSLYELARLEFSAGNIQTAETLAKEGIKLLESVRTRIPGPDLRASFYARKRNLLDLLVSIKMGLGGELGAEQSFLAADREQSRALLDLLAERYSATPGPAEFREERMSIRRRIDMATYRPSADPRQREGIFREVQSLVARDEEIEARILESTALREPGSRPLASLDDLKKDFLPADSAILEYHMGEQSSGLWLITRSETRVFQLASRDQIERSIEVAVDLFGGYVERKSDRKKQDKFDSAMRRLSAILLGPLRGIELPQRLLLVLDDDLHRLPFAALRLPDGQYLGLTHDLVRVPSAAYLVQGRKVSRQENFPKVFLAFCDPVFSSNDRRLSDAVRSEGTIGLHLSRLFFKDELTTVSSFVPAARRTFRCSFDANVDAVQKMPLDEYAIIHFSTHTIVDDRIPGLSRIVLSSVDRRGRAREGVLFSHQLAELHLRGSLVVLSACDTALGQKVVGEGLLGFASSLFSAGASQLVLTLTEVDAKGASVFLSRMYRHLLGGTSTTAEHSIMLANRDLVRSKAKRWADPYYWASFVIVGKPAHADETAGNR